MLKEWVVGLDFILFLGVFVTLNMKSNNVYYETAPLCHRKAVTVERNQRVHKIR